MLLYHYCTNTVVQGIIAIITIYILVPSENCELKQILLPPPSKIYVFLVKFGKFVILSHTSAKSTSIMVLLIRTIFKFKKQLNHPPNKPTFQFNISSFSLLE